MREGYKLKSTPKQITASKKINRSVAKANMRRLGFTQITKDKGSGSFFANNWRDYIIY